MKLNPLLLAAVAAAAVASSASAQTVINITGATAFRQAAHDAIINSLTGVTYGYQGTNIGNAGRAIFRGTNNGNDVIVRTSWSGSVAGLRAVVNQADAVTYYAANVAGLTPGGTANLSTAGGNSETPANSTNNITFADNQQSNTPYDGVFLNGGPVGVVAFVPVANETSRLAQGANITKSQLQRLAGFGSVPLQFITQNVADATFKAYWTGRQDTSGTRVITAAELGLGYGAALNQYRVEPLDTTTGAVSAIQLWPVGDATNRSVIYNMTDTVGNGGYSSGGALAPALQRTSSGAVAVLDGNGAPVAGETGKEVVLISIVAAQEGNDIKKGGGVILSYNGVGITPIDLVDGGLSSTDVKKITQGDYTLWSYENLYFRDEAFDGVTDVFLTDLTAAIPGVLAGNGVAISDMQVTRASDGGLVVPLSTLP